MTLESPTKVYEVRCSRCDVSFPVETRRCTHCGGPTGGPTGRADQILATDSIGAMGEMPVQIFSDPTSAMPELDERGLEVAEESKSPIRTLLRSLGGFVWIIVIIGFTLAKNCGGNDG